LGGGELSNWCSHSRRGEEVCRIVTGPQGVKKTQMKRREKNPQISTTVVQSRGWRGWRGKTGHDLKREKFAKS